MYKKLKLKGKDPQNFSIVNLFYVHAQIVKNANSLVRLPLKSGIYLYMVKNVSHLFFFYPHIIDHCKRFAIAYVNLQICKTYIKYVLF